MDMSTSFLGLKLKNPLVPSASPLSRDLSTLKQLEDSGAAAVVLYSLFEEEITLRNKLLNEHLTQGTESFAEALSYFPEAGAYRTGPDSYLEHVRRAKEALSIPLIASLNGVSTGGWIRYAKQIEEAGADALELNVYYLSTDSEISGGEIEQMYTELVSDVTGSIDIPVAVKLNPFFSSIPHAVQQMGAAGAAGAVLFNRFYQPDIDIENLEVTPNLVLSDSSELRLPLRWISILYGRVDVDLALTTGVHTGEDAIKGIMAGAAVTMMASELLQNGVRRLGQILTEMSMWMTEKEYESIQQMRGSMSQVKTAEPAAFERANYMRVLGSYSPAHN
jgi:dihydroorotate dehydrogenase (fumarate)